MSSALFNVGFLRTCGKHDRISLRAEAWPHKTFLATTHCIEVPIPNKELKVSGHIFIC